MTDTKFPWFLAAVAAGLAAVVGVVTWVEKARAEWPNDAFTCRSYRADLYWQSWARRHCPGYRWRHHWRARHHAPYASGDAVCQPVVESTGDQGQSEAAARENALTSWRGRVRFKYGERYTKFESARNPHEVCAPSSIPDAYRDQKLPPLFRCEISARPCRIEAKRLDKDDD